MWFDPQTLLARSYPPATSATSATSATFEVQAGTKVAESQESQQAANDAALDPDSYCWPHSSAWNTSEIALFNRRAALFVRRGASDTEAERLVEKLVQRDREGDSMHACMECRHLQTSGAWRCGNWQAADVAVRAGDAGLARAMAMQAQRCPGFAAAALPATAPPFVAAPESAAPPASPAPPQATDLGRSPDAPTQPRSGLPDPGD